MKVTPTQWLALVEGLAKGLHGSSLMGFYSLARAILAKDESELDDFDMVFAAHFRGLEEAVEAIEEEVWRWLENPIAPRHGLTGELIGHIVLGRDIVREAATGYEWPDERLPLLLEHILISHHGELEYGAVVLPKSPEAICVYHFDNLSAKLNMMRMQIDTDGDDGDFTCWSQDLGRRVFKAQLRRD